MSWWVRLHDDDNCTVVVPKHSEGGTIAIGGTTDADLNITYNYSKLFAMAWDGLTLSQAINGKQAKDTIALLERGVEKLGDNPDGDYWAATPGNAGHALAILLAWARKHPSARFHID